MNLLETGAPKIFESWRPFEDFYTIPDGRGIVPNINKIKSLNDRYDFVLANLSVEHWGAEKNFPLTAWLNELLTEHFHSDFLILSHDPVDQRFSSKIRYFPFWLRMTSKSVEITSQAIRNAHRRYLLSNLNLKARDFRIANYLMLMQYPQKDKFLITMSDSDTHTGYNGQFDLSESELQNWEQFKKTLPCHDDCERQIKRRSTTDGSGNASWGLMDIQHPAFVDAYLHLVTESTIHDKIFLTEKTWKAVASGQIFLIWGGAGIIAHLRDLGVDVFDDIIDHSYDFEDNHRQRLQMIHRELDRLLQLDLSAIYSDTVYRRQHNSYMITSGELIESYTYQLNNILSRYINR